MIKMLAQSLICFRCNESNYVNDQEMSNPVNSRNAKNDINGWWFAGHLDALKGLEYELINFVNYTNSQMKGKTRKSHR